MQRAFYYGLIFLSVIILIGLFYQYLLRYILIYRFKDKGLAAVYFGFVTVMYVKYEEIEDVRIMPLKDSLFRGGMRTLRAGNKLTGPVVAFKRTKGVMNQFFLTPGDPAVFAEELKNKIASALKVETTH